MTKWFAEGSKVRGTYCSQAFTGVVLETRPHTIHPTRIEHTVSLDNPIQVYGDVRTRVIVATCDPKEWNKIEMQS